VRVDRFFPDRPGPGFCAQWPIELSLEEARQRGATRKVPDLTDAQLFEYRADIRLLYPDSEPTDEAKQRMPLTVELNKRFAMSASCFAFALLGMPLGVKSHRKESSISVAISLLVAFSFYLFIIVADSLSRQPELQPYLFVWFPIALSLILGVFLIERTN
jgi:lipopolysaccharide export system permease protein